MIKKVILLVIFAFVLRILFISQGAVSFHYDMSRDAYEAKDIWQNHDVKIQGPSTTTPGLYSGVFYYYLLSLPYGLSHGDPRIAALFLSLINSLTIIPVFLLAKDIFKSSKWAILASLFFAVSFEAIQYGPWLSNPGPAIFTIAMFFYSFRLWQKGSKWGLPLSVIFAGLSAQLEFFLTFLFATIIIFKFLFNIKVTFKQVFYSIALSLLILSTFVISMIKFNTFTQTTRAFFTIFQNTEVNFRVTFTDLLSNFLNRFSDLYINNFFPVNVFIGGMLALAVLFTLFHKSFIAQNDKNLDRNPYRFILFCLLSYLLIFIFGGQNAAYTTVGMVIPAILGMTILLQNVFKINNKFGISLIVVIVVSNLYMTFKIAPQGQQLLVIPKDMVLKNQLNLIDQTYKLAEGKPFSINSLTVPLWTNTTWAYLYLWYGKNKYNYLPSFYGHDQVGLKGDNDLEKVEKGQDISFFIIEPHIGIPENIYKQEIEAENNKTLLIKEISYGDLKLQLRKPKASE